MNKSKFQARAHCMRHCGTNPDKAAIGCELPRCSDIEPSFPKKQMHFATLFCWAVVWNFLRIHVRMICCTSMLRVIFFSLRGQRALRCQPMMRHQPRTCQQSHARTTRVWEPRSGIKDLAAAVRWCTSGLYTLEKGCVYVFQSIQ